MILYKILIQLDSSYLPKQIYKTNRKAQPSLLTT